MTQDFTDEMWDLTDNPKRKARRGGRNDTSSEPDLDHIDELSDSLDAGSASGSLTSGIFDDVPEGDTSDTPDDSSREVTVSNVRKEYSKIELMSSNATDRSKEDRATQELSRKLSEPAQDGWRGFLNNLGLSLPAGEEELAKRKRVYQDTIEQIKMRKELSTDKTGPKVIAVFSEKGGAGKSTTSAVLAYGISTFGNKPVGLCEVNSDKGTLGVKVGTGSDKCLPDLIEAIETGDDTVDPRKYMPKIDNLNINVLAGNSSHTDHSTSAADVVRVAQVVERVWPVVILDNGISLDDSGASLEDKTSAVGSFAVADRLILVTNPDVAEATEVINSTLAMLERNMWNKHISSSDASAWRALRETVILVVVDKNPTAETMKLSTGEENDGDLIGSEDAFEVYEQFHSKVKSVVIMPYDPALQKNPIDMRAMRGRTKKVATRLAYKVWKDLD